ncbi:hypothetical protein HHK36_002367 [Tetracentron sinense]|uniref:RNase H type-1 domain-containing protein n=1 Tax=Tetracentron sinense TaxID=13715 RepID=A0A835DR35_TETSI|nr:hypothetical protein HHK36_002367 [Tetracentron sinense]
MAFSNHRYHLSVFEALIHRQNMLILQPSKLDAIDHPLYKLVQEPNKILQTKEQKFLNPSLGGVSKSCPEEAVLSYVEPELVDGELVIQMSNEDLEANSAEWCHSLVGSFVGPRPPFHMVKAAVSKMWKVSGSLEVRLDKVVFKVLPLWIRVIVLPLFLWNQRRLSRVASLIGKPLCVDKPTLDKSRLNYARIYVEVVADKPLMEELTVNLNGLDHYKVNLESGVEQRRARYRSWSKAPRKPDVPKSGWEGYGRAPREVKETSRASSIDRDHEESLLHNENISLIDKEKDQLWSVASKKKGRSRGVGQERKHEVQDFVKRFKLGVVGLVETKVKHSSATVIACKILDGWCCLDNYNWADHGRIWIFWDPSMVKLDMVGGSMQSLHVLASRKEWHSPVLLSFVYGSNLRIERGQLWRDITAMSHLYNIPWAVLGDFNTVGREVYPLVIFRFDVSRKAKPRAFKFYNYWIEHAEFLEVVKRVWRCRPDVEKAKERCREIAAKMERRLGCTDLQMEEKGANLLLLRRNWNRIDTIRDSDGNLITDYRDVAKCGVDYFSDLFSAMGVDDDAIWQLPIERALDDEDKESLMAGISRLDLVSSTRVNNNWNVPMPSDLCFHDFWEDLHRVQTIGEAHEDKVVWMANSNGRFSISFAWQVVRQRQPEVKWHQLASFSNNIPRHSFITWLAFRSALMTQDKLVSWGVLPSTCCVLCNGDVEDIDHLFCLCSFAKEIWLSLLAILKLQRRSFARWSKAMCWFVRKSRGRDFCGQLHKLFFCAFVYQVWAERNSRIFSSTYRTPTSIVLRIKEDVSFKIDWRISISNNPVHRELVKIWNGVAVWESRSMRWVAWKPPEGDVITINIDGSWRATVGGYGCIFRTACGSPIVAIAGGQQEGSVNAMELKAIRRGLEVASQEC